MIQTTKGALIEYAQSAAPLSLVFEFNPRTLSRTRRVTVKTGNAPGTLGGYDFTLPTETPRASQGVTVHPESFSAQIMLDATDRMNGGDPTATELGIVPELDTLRSMIEPKSQGPSGLQTLASLGRIGKRAFQRNQSASVLLFAWGYHILPVFLTSVRVDEKAHLPSLMPYRAEVALKMQVIEGNNPFYKAEQVRQVVFAALNTGRNTAGVLEGLF